MSVIYPLSIINQRLNIVVSAIDDGPSSGFLRLLDSGGNVLSSMQLAFPAANVSNGVMSFNGLSLVDPAATRSGAAVAARIDDSLGVTWVTGLTVTGASTGPAAPVGDIILSPTANIVAGQTIAITNAAITGH